MGEMLWCVLVEPEVNWRSTTLVFLDPVTFSQGSSKHKKGLDCAFCFLFSKRLRGPSI